MSRADELTIVVLGTPAPQGSKRAIRNQHTGRIQQVEASAKVKPWREAVHHAALEVCHPNGDPDTSPGWYPFRDTAVYIEATFTLPRPKSHYRTGRNAELLRDNAPDYPTGKPDVDKLLRSTLDALYTSAVLANDAQIVDCFGRKRYPDTHPDALTVPGALIRVRPMTATTDTALLRAAHGKGE